MRIISKFHDYYDSAQALGQDNSVVYVRKTEDLEDFSFPIRPYMPLFKGPSTRHYNTMINIKNGHISFVPFAIYFAGKIYYGIKANVTQFEKGENNYSTEFFWSIDQLNEFLAPHDYVISHPRYYIERKDTIKTIGLIDYPKLRSVMIEHKIVSALYHNEFGQKYWIKDPILREWGFQKIIDPWTAFQEISMYLGNELAGERQPPVAVSDKIRAEKHGMDKWSFRRTSAEKPNS